MIDYLLNQTPVCTLPQAETIPLTGNYFLHAIGADQDRLLRWHGDAGAEAYAIGVIWYDGTYGVDALSRLAADVLREQVDEGTLGGSFHCVVTGSGKIHVFSDWLGSVAIYRCGKTISSSFLLAAAAAAGVTVNPQALYEYVFQGTSYGGDTLFAQVEQLAADSVYEVVANERRYRNTAFLSTDQGDPLEEIHAELCHVFTQIKRQFGSGIESALSAGFDSRLILAHLLNADADFSLHVYGDRRDADVQVSQQVAESLNLTLRHVDKKAFLQDKDPHEIVERNFMLFDGYPIDGIFDNGADLATRSENMAGKVLLNGGGGEIYRNFFYLSPWARSLDDVVDAFYHQFDPARVGAKFDYPQYIDCLTAKIRAEVANLPLDPRQLCEAVYPLFRGRYWTARNGSINMRLGDYLTPLVTPLTVSRALRLPSRAKNDGRFQCGLISAAHTAAASLPFDYGFSAVAGPGRKQQVQGLLTRLRPGTLRKRAFSIKNRNRDAIWATLASRYEPFVGDQFEQTRNYVDSSLIKTAAQMDRLATAEYLFQKFNAQHA